MRKARLTRKILLMASPEWVAAIDDWRSGGRPIPSRSAAIRALVTEALGSKTGEGRPPPPPASAP